jgi:hypothetical protein
MTDTSPFAMHLCHPLLAIILVYVPFDIIWHVCYAQLRELISCSSTQLFYCLNQRWIISRDVAAVDGLAAVSIVVGHALFCGGCTPFI